MSTTDTTTATDTLLAAADLLLADLAVREAPLITAERAAADAYHAGVAGTLRDKKRAWRDTQTALWFLRSMTTQIRRYRSMRAAELAGEPGA